MEQITDEQIPEKIKGNKLFAVEVNVLKLKANEIIENVNTIRQDLELIGGGSRTLSTTKTISSAEILSSNTSPIELLPEISIEAGYEILSIQCKYTYNGVKYTTNLDAEIKFHNSASLISIIDLAFAENRIEYLDVNKAALGGLPVVFQTRGGNPNAGNGTIELTIEYKIIELDVVDAIYQNFIDRAINDGGTVENLSGLNDLIDQLISIE